MGTTTGPIDGIEDTTVRRFVRAIVHVRRFLPFSVAGAAFALTMATPVSERAADRFDPLPLGWLFRLMAWA